MDEVIAVQTDYRIVRECADWVVVDKPAPLIVHPTSAKKEPTLVTLLEAHYEGLGEEVALSLINRLDRETSGLVLIAKNSGAARVFGRAMMRREIGKEYLAVVRGWPEWAEERVVGPLIRRGEVEELEGSFVWVRQVVHETGKESVTRLYVQERIERKEGRFSLLRVVTETGRMHQIRVHCEYAGFPMVGDKIYGGDEGCYLEFVETGWSEGLQERLLLERQALHASVMEFEWEDERVRVECGLRGDLADFVLNV